MPWHNYPFRPPLHIRSFLNSTTGSSWQHLDASAHGCGLSVELGSVNLDRLYFHKDHSMVQCHELGALRRSRGLARPFFGTWDVALPSQQLTETLAALGYQHWDLLMKMLTGGQESQRIFQWTPAAAACFGKRPANSALEG